jgi:hypothetical protein
LRSTVFSRASLHPERYPEGDIAALADTKRQLVHDGILTEPTSCSYAVAEEALDELQESIGDYVSLH